MDNLQSRIVDSPGPYRQHTPPEVLRVKLVGANRAAKIVGTTELPGKSNYFIGNNPKKWRTNVANYAKVRYQEIYPGVDLVYYGNQGGQLEYDFVVAPGANPNVVTLEVGAEDVRPAKGERGSPLEITGDGDLIIHTEDGEVRFRKPVVYQPAAGRGHWMTESGGRTVVEGHYVLTVSNHVRVVPGPYDHTRPLVIDPVLIYSTYLGGSYEDEANGIAVDAAGNAYVTGYTESWDFPVLNSLQLPCGDCGDNYAFVTKLNADGSAMAYSTYLGSSSPPPTIPTAMLHMARPSPSIPPATPT